MKWFKVLKSCHQNQFFAKIKKEFFRLWRSSVGPATAQKPPNELDRVLKSGQIMLSKQLICKNRILFFSIAWWNDSSILPPEGLLWAPVAAQNHQMSLMKCLKVIKSCYQINYFTKIEKQFFRLFDGMIPAYSFQKGCCERLLLHKTILKLQIPSPISLFKNRFHRRFHFSGTDSTTDSIFQPPIPIPIPLPIPFRANRFPFRFRFWKSIPELRNRFPFYPESIPESVLRISASILS